MRHKPRKAIPYAPVQLSHPVIENHFTESNVIYGVESFLNIFSPRSQVLDCDCDIRLRGLIFQIDTRSWVLRLNHQCDTRPQVINCQCDTRSQALGCVCNTQVSVVHPVAGARPD